MCVLYTAGPREIEMPIESMLTFVAVSALLSIAPGPDNIFVLTQSALYGKKSGVLVTLGLCTGLIFHTTAVALGVATIFQSSSLAFTLLKVAGAVYLAYLAWQAFRASAKNFETAGSNLRSRGALYRRGIIMSTTNPKLSIFSWPFCHNLHHSSTALWHHRFFFWVVCSSLSPC